jgi:hypothetical protein
MTNTKRSCFVIMPFLPELHYFYLFMKNHIEKNHNISCKRGDADILTVPLLNKIRSYIEESDILIADCSGRNCNVFYELGMAHAFGKQVILITKDPIIDAPVDIKHYEFIKYELNKHIEFLEALDRALRKAFIDRYDELFSFAESIFTQFIKQTHSNITIASKDRFIDRIIAAEQVGRIPNTDDEVAFQEFVLPRIVSDNSDFTVMKQITEWLTFQLSQKTN